MFYLSTLLNIYIYNIKTSLEILEMKVILLNRIISKEVKVLNLINQKILVCINKKKNKKTVHADYLFYF